MKHKRKRMHMLHKHKRSQLWDELDHGMLLAVAEQWS
jgi:hypothetical protein